MMTFLKMALRFQTRFAPFYFGLIWMLPGGVAALPGDVKPGVALSEVAILPETATQPGDALPESETLPGSAGFTSITPTHNKNTATLQPETLGQPLLSRHQNSEKPNLEAEFLEAVDLFEQGLYAEAYAIFKKIRFTDPELGSNLGLNLGLNLGSGATNHSSLAEQADYYAVRSLIRMGGDDAHAETDRFLRRYPKSRYAAELLQDAASRNAEMGDLDQAIERAIQALDYPQSAADHAKAFDRVAEYAIAAGKTDLARTYYLNLANRHPRSALAPKALYARGSLYLQEEKFAEATGAFELLTERFPYDEMTRRIGTALGESYYRQKKYDLAIQAFEDQFFYLDDERQRKAIYLMAESANALNDLKNASRLYRMLLNRSEDEEEQRMAHFGLGWTYHKQGIWHWAADSFGKAAGDGTNQSSDLLSRKALYYKAVNHKLAGQFQESLETFRTFGSRFREGEFLRHAYFEWAVTAFEAGFYGEAIEALLPLARNYQTIENSGEVLSFLGEVYYANQEYSRAVETFELAATITDIDDRLKQQARFQMAWLRYSNQSYQQAADDFESVADEWPSSDLGREALFWSADARYRMEDYDPASIRYARFIRENPDHELTGAAKYALGWAYFMMGEFSKATAPLIDFLENYEPPPIALYPYETDTRLRIGDAFYAQGAYSEALRYYRMAVGAEPGGDYAIYQMANSYYRQNRNFDAVTQFRRMIRIYPFSRLREQSQYNIAYIYLTQANYDQAIEEFQKVIERYPGTEWAARSQYNIGDAHYNAGDYAEAVAAYQKVLQNHPKSRYVLEAVDGIQYAQLSAGENDESTNLLEQFLNENPASETADRLRFRQAVNTLQTGNYEAAVKEFRQYLRITNNRQMMPEAYFNMADAYLRLGDTDAAAIAYNTVAEEFPGSERAAPSLAELGLIELERGNPEKAAVVFTQLAEKDSRFHQEAYTGRGDAYLELGQPDLAEADYLRVLDIQAQNDAARIGLSRIALLREQPDTAAETLRDIAAKNSTELGAEAQFLLGEVALAKADRETALEEYRKVNVLFEIYDEWVSMARYRMAEIYIRQGRRTDAVNLLQEIIETYPGTQGAVQAAQLLDRS